MPLLQTEFVALWSALLAYVGAGVFAIFAVLMKRRPERTVLALMVVGLCLHTVSLAARWVRLDHGPFVGMFEILSSNVWSFMLAYALAYWRIKALRPTTAVVMPILFLMMAWMMLVGARDTLMPPTYDTIWLYVHIGFGKVFMGTMLIAIGLAGVVLLRRFGLNGGLLRSMAPDPALVELAYRFMAAALVFDGLMLVAGAIWAQDAWGRYWAWDPLETWSFVTWLLLGFAIHLRATFRLSPVVASSLVWAVFVLAFLTFFGIPFISDAPHKGAV